MARPTKAESENRVQRIIDIAAELFSDKGIQNTTVNEIARGCGIKAPSVLYYFGTKEAIFLEVIRQKVYQRFITEFKLDGIDFKQPPENILEDALSVGLEVWKSEPRLIAAVFAEFLRPGGIGRIATNEFLTPLLTQFESAAQTILPDGVAESLPVRELSLMFIMSLAGRFSSLDQEPSLWGDEEDVVKALKLILDSVIRAAK